MDFTEAYEDTCSSVGHAIRIENIEELRNCIDNGSPVDVSDNRGWKPLHEAAALSIEIQFLDILLQHPKTNVNWLTHEGESALLLACKRRTRHTKEAVTLLLHHGAQPNIHDNDQETPLLVATKKGDLAIVNLLISAHANVNLKDCGGWTPLHEAAKSNEKLVILQRLLASDADIDCQDECGLTPVFVAAQHGQITCLQELLRIARLRGIQDIVNRGAVDAATPLMLAAQQGFTDCVKLLIDYGADTNVQMTDETTALHSAVQGNHVQCLRLLLDKMNLVPLINSCRPLSYQIDSRSQIPPLHLAIEWQSYDCLKMLLEAKFSPDSVRKSAGMHVERLLGLELSMCESAFSFAISNKDKTAACILLEAGATPDVPCLYAVHPVLIAIFHPSSRMLDFLLQKGSNVNYCSQQRFDTNTILICALVCPQWDWCVPKLLRAGSDPKLCFSNSTSIGLLTSSILHFSAATPFAWRMLLLLQFVVIDATVQHAYQSIEAKSAQMGLHDDNIWKDIREIIGQPSSLKHTCRMVIRHCMYTCYGSRFSNLLRTLPLPPTVVNYLDFRPLSTNERCCTGPLYRPVSPPPSDSDEDMSADFQEETIHLNLPQR